MVVSSTLEEESLKSAVSSLGSDSFSSGFSLPRCGGVTIGDGTFYSGGGVLCLGGGGAAGKMEKIELDVRTLWGGRAPGFTSDGHLFCLSKEVTFKGDVVTPAAVLLLVRGRPLRVGDQGKARR